MNKQIFYSRCAEILDVEHTYDSYNDTCYNGRTTNAGRFTGRQPGNGRFANIGLIRHYGAVIHVMISSKNVVFNNEQAVYDFLQTL
jgi:hypothetical protein